MKHNELIRRLRDECCTCKCNTELLAMEIKCDPCQAADALEAASLNERRYLWLRDNPDVLITRYSDRRLTITEPEIDGAIDAALASETRSGGGA